MTKSYRWEDGIEIVGFDQFKNVVFKSRDRNIDLFDNFFLFNGRDGSIDDQYWISISFPDDLKGDWDNQALEYFEEQIKEDFDYEGYIANTHIENREYGEDWPRCVPMCWYFTLKAKPEDQD